MNCHSKKRRLDDFNARLRWAQDQLGEQSLVFYAVLDKSGRFTSSGGVGDTDRADLCLSAIFDLVRDCAREYTSKHGYDFDEFWSYLTRNAFRDDEGDPPPGA